MLLKFLVHICWDVTNPRACCVGLLDFSGPAAQHLRILCPAAWVSWISPGLLRSICVDVALFAGLRLKNVAEWISWISPGLLSSILWYIVCGRYCEVSVFLLVAAIWSVVEI